MIETWLLLSLGAVLLYGTSQVAQKLSLAHIPASGVVTLSMLIATPISVICLMPYVVTGLLFEMRWAAFAIAVVAAICGQMGYYLYLEAAQRGPISIVGSVMAAYPMMVIVVALVLLSESPGGVQLSGVMLVTSSVILLSYLHGGNSKPSRFSGRYLSLSIAALVCYGLWAVFTKLVLGDVEPLLFLGIYTFVIPPTVLVYYRYKGIRFRRSVPSWSVPFIIAIIASEIGNIGFFLEVNAAALGPASVVFPLVAASPVVVVVLAYSFLKERLTRTEVLLVVAVIAGILMASAQ